MTKNRQRWRRKSGSKRSGQRAIRWECPCRLTREGANRCRDETPGTESARSRGLARPSVDRLVRQAAKSIAPLQQKVQTALGVATEAGDLVFSYQPRKSSMATLLHVWGVINLAIPPERRWGVRGSFPANECALIRDEQHLAVHCALTGDGRQDSCGEIVLVALVEVTQRQLPRRMSAPS